MKPELAATLDVDFIIFGAKTCISCGVALPANTEHFSPATVRRMHREGVLTNVLPTKKLIVSKAQLRKLGVGQ